MGLRGNNKPISIQVENQALRAKVDEHTAQLAETVINAVEQRTNIFSRKSTASIKKAIVFIDDDGRIETFTRFKNLADEKSIKISSCISTALIGSSANYMSWEQVKQMDSEGHDILVHGYTHTELVPLTDAQVEEQLSLSKRDMIANGLKAEHLVYTGGSYDKRISDMTRKYYKSGIEINSQINYFPLENYAVTRYNLDTSSLATLTGLADTLNGKTSGLLVFMSHSWNSNWTATKEQEFKDFIDYINTLGIDILTWSEVFEHFGNVIEVGSKKEGQYFKIDSYGNIYNQIYDNVAANRYPKNSLSFTTPPSSFKVNELSITYFDGGATDTGFPVRKEGTLVTIGSPITQWQLWFPLDINNFYLRNKSNTGDTWNIFRTSYPMYATVTIDFGEVPAHSTKDINITMTGVIYGQSIITVNPHNSLIAGIMVGATVKADDTITVRVANVTANPITIPSTQKFKLNVIHN